jgi:hypothetical protein
VGGVLDRRQLLLPVDAHYFDRRQLLLPVDAHYFCRSGSPLVLDLFNRPKVTGGDR